MLRIRLSRVGRKHDPSYRVIVTEKGRGPQTGAYVEKLGTYDPRSDEYDLKAERIQHWISEGAKPSDTMHNLLVKAEIIEGDTINPLPKKSPVVAEEPEEDDDTQEPEDAATEDDALEEGESEGETDSDNDQEESAEDDSEESSTESEEEEEGEEGEDEKE